MRGKYTAEEINNLVAERIGMSFEELWKLFVADCTTMQVSGTILGKLSSLRSKYVVILITGNMDSFSRFTVPALHLDEYFDHINNSFFEGKLKDDEKGAVFAKYADTLRTALERCFLIDDSARACESFKALGGTAYRITPERNIMSYLEKMD
jgi:FMN phosphatase YigB (HAD superfamily)